MNSNQRIVMDAPPIARPERRLDPVVFELDVERIRAGYYTDKYFLNARHVLISAQRRTSVTMQFFQKRRAWLAGIDEAIALLKLCLTDGYSWSDLDVRALRDGDVIEPWEPVLEVTGPYAAFAHLETPALGALARRTQVITSTRLVVEAAAPKGVFFFPARHDHWLVQAGDGYAAHLAGVTGVSTDAQASWYGALGMGTVPHALIAAYDGDTVLATQAFAEHMDPGTRIVSLVDFENDSVATSLAVARALGDRLYGVRLDTSEMLVDRSVVSEMGDFAPTGVNPQLVHNVRRALDAEGFEHVRIVASGGFNEEKVRRFEAAGVPVDSYGVGSSLYRDRYDFTADVVLTEGRARAKVGRRYRENPRLERVD